MPPAKKARVERWDAGEPSRLLRLILGRVASLAGSKPSEVLASHKTLVDVLCKLEPICVQQI